MCQRCADTLDHRKRPPRKEKEPIIMIPLTNYRLCVLLALRLCDWLFDNRSGHMMDIHQDFLLAFRTEQWQMRQDCVPPELYPGFVVADRA
jgi:hypothetical protein